MRTSSGDRKNLIIALLDNGSIRAESTLSLRRAALQLSKQSGSEVLAVSLAHSHRADVNELGGQPALLLHEFLQRPDVQTGRPALILPFFLGNRGSIARQMEKRVKECAERNSDCQLAIAPYLFEEEGEDQGVLAAALADRIRSVADSLAEPARVIVVDHGSPVPMAAQVRNFVAGQVQALLGEAVLSVTPASMERREGEAYAFTDPLLEEVLRRPSFQNHPVILGMFFLLPGKHAGSSGDVDQICKEAKEHCPSLCIHRTELLAEHPFVLSALEKRIAKFIV